MTVAAACTVRTQYGSGGSSGNGSRRTGRFIDSPPPPPRAPPPPLPLLGCSSGLTSPFSHLSRHRGKNSAGQSRQGGRLEPGHGSLPVSSRPDMREKGRRKKGRTWAEAAKTVRRRERSGKPGGFRSFSAHRSQGKRRGGGGVNGPATRLRGQKTARRGRRLVSGLWSLWEWRRQRKRVATGLWLLPALRRILLVF